MLDLAFIACVAFIAVETVLLLVASVAGRKVPVVRVITYLVVIIAAVTLGLLVAAAQPSGGVT